MANVVRFYGTENLKRIFTKWAAQKYPEQTIDAAEFRRVMPLLATASMASEDELQDRWAALLESAAAGAKGYLPSFGHTLSQMTVQEAKVLRAFWIWVNNQIPPQYGEIRSIHTKTSDRELLSIVYPDIPLGTR